MSDGIAILQFGTSRFLLAHVDLFVSEAMERGEAIGGIAVVQTTASGESAARIAALRSEKSYPVRIRGIEGGRVLDETRRGNAIREALTAAGDWRRIRALARDVAVIVSNTGDRGFELLERDLSQGHRLQVAGHGLKGLHPRAAQVAGLVRSNASDHALRVDQHATDLLLHGELSEGAGPRR